MYRNLYLKFFFSFLIFGFLIVSTVYIINNSILKSTINDLKSTFVESFFKMEEYSLKNSLDNAKNNLINISKTKELENYINNNDDEKELKNLFYNFISSNYEIFQLRYIDILGNEKIKIKKNSLENEIKIISDKELQNKINNKYFKETIKLTKNEFYISDIDLNKEYGKVQIPIQPTLHISTCIYDKNNEKKGILILNLNMNQFINTIKYLQNFDSYLIDKEGNFLLHPNSKKQWTKDLKIKFKVSDEFDKTLSRKISLSNKYKSNFVFIYSLENTLKNNQNLKIIYIAKKAYIDEILNKSNTNLLKIIIPLTLFLGLLIAIYPSKIREKLLLVLRKNERNIKIIDKFVPVSITNEKGIITEVNQAFCDLTSYSKDELIGYSNNKLKSGRISNEIYKELWNTIKDDKTWKGELENKKKNGQTYWIEMYIEPRFNTETNQKEYVAIANNITDKKLTEELAQTDHLTNLYNRKRIDEELKKALYGVKRYNEDISIMMLDIDFFKLINDNYGHSTGDSVLVELSNLLRSNVRKTDIVGRWGGEEFLIIAHNTSKEEIHLQAAIIKEYINNYNFKIVGKRTVSIGYTQIKSLDSDITDAINRADKALYKAKSNGRNRIEGYKEINK